MLNLENEEITDAKWWERTLTEIEGLKKKMYGKLNWTPWGHVNELKKDPDFVRKLHRHGKVSADFLKKLGIEVK